MKAIFFVEIEGIRFYKTDTFWSKSKDFTNAKVHTDSEDDKRRFFAPLIESVISNRLFLHLSPDYKIFAIKNTKDVKNSLKELVEKV